MAPVIVAKSYDPIDLKLSETPSFMDEFLRILLETSNTLFNIGSIIFLRTTK